LLPKLHLNELNKIYKFKFISMAGVVTWANADGKIIPTLENKDMERRVRFEFDTFNEMHYEIMSFVIDKTLEQLKPEPKRKRKKKRTWAQTKAEFIAKVEEFRGVVVGEYVRMNDPVECQCEFGHQCAPRPARLLFDPKLVGICNKCYYVVLTARMHARGEKARQAFLDKMESLGGKVVGEYKNSYTPVASECPYGHKAKPSPEMVRTRDYVPCAICANMDPKKAEQDFRQRVRNHGGTVLGQYVNSYTPVKCCCPKNHICSPMPSSLHTQGLCKTCAGHDPAASEQEFINNVAALGGTVVGKYKYSSQPVECLCQHDHKCFPRPSDLRKGIGMCARCRQSQGEQMLGNHLEELGLKCQPQLKLETGKYAPRYDYGNDEYIFEFDGIQHFQDITFFTKLGGRRSFENQRATDLNKTITALKTRKLIRLHYSWAKLEPEERLAILKAALQSDAKLVVSHADKYEWLSEHNPIEPNLTKRARLV